MVASLDLSVVALSAGLALVLTTVLWPIAGLTITLAHEGGHAAMGLAMSGRVESVTIHPNREGWTLSYPIRGLDNLWVGVAGYLGPSAFGYVGAVVLGHGRPDAVLWTSVVLIALLFTASGNWFGRLIMVATALALLITARKGSDGVQLVVSCTWVWFLLLGGLRHVLAHGSHGGDHAILRDLTMVPRSVWFLLFLVGSLAALVAGGAILVGAVAPPF